MDVLFSEGEICLMDICWSTVLFNVREAKQELDGLVQDLELAESGKEPLLELNEGRLAASLSHAYHHLNTAWRARGRDMPRADRTFAANEKWPRGWHFDRYCPKRCLDKERI